MTPIVVILSSLSWELHPTPFALLSVHGVLDQHAKLTLCGNGVIPTTTGKQFVGDNNLETVCAKNHNNCQTE